MRILFGVLLVAASIRADTVSVQGSLFGQAWDASCDDCGAGVGITDLRVNPDGTWMILGLYQPSDTGLWLDTGAIDFPTLPEGATINYAILTYDVPLSESFSEPLYPTCLCPDAPPDGSVAIDLSYWIDGGNVWEGPDYGSAPIWSGSSAQSSIRFVPTSTSFALAVDFSGGLGIAMNGLTPPSTPGDYAMEYLATGPQIDYTLTVDYTTVPEPGVWWLVGVFSAVICVGAARRRGRVLD